MKFVVLSLRVIDCDENNYACRRTANQKKTGTKCFVFRMPVLWMCCGCVVSMLTLWELPEHAEEIDLHELYLHLAVAEDRVTVEVLDRLCDMVAGHLSSSAALR